LDGIDKVCQNFVLVHLPPPICNDHPIIVFRIKEHSRGVVSTMSGKMNGIVLPVLYQILNSDSIAVHRLGPHFYVTCASVYGWNKHNRDKECQKAFSHSGTPEDHQGGIGSSTERP